MTTKQELQARHQELGNYARAKGWDPRGFQAWSNGAYTVSVATRGYPKRDFVITNQRTLDSRYVRSLEEIEQFLDYVRCTGVEPG